MSRRQAIIRASIAFDSTSRVSCNGAAVAVVFMTKEAATTRPAIRRDLDREPVARSSVRQATGGSMGTSGGQQWHYVNSGRRIHGADLTMCASFTIQRHSPKPHGGSLYILAWK